MVIMGRPTVPTRAPLPTATKERQAFIESELETWTSSKPSPMAGEGETIHEL